MQGVGRNCQQCNNCLFYISVSTHFVILGYIYITIKVPRLCLSYGDTNLGGSSSLYHVPNQIESSPQVREVRRKRRVVLQRCRGLGLYMVSGSATVLFLRETHNMVLVSGVDTTPRKSCSSFTSTLGSAALCFLFSVSQGLHISFQLKLRWQKLWEKEWWCRGWKVSGHATQKNQSVAYLKPNHVLAMLCKLRRKQ